MMKYIKNNVDQFNDKTNCTIAFSVAYMKWIGGIFTEIVNIIIIIRSESVTDIVKDFIALGIIAEIDDYVGKSLKLVDLEEEIDQAKIEYPTRQIYASSDFKLLKEMKSYSFGRRWSMRLMLIGYKIINLLYTSVYFYFTPFLFIFVIEFNF